MRQVPGSRGSGLGLRVLEAGWEVTVRMEDTQDVEVARLLEIEDEVGEPLYPVCPQPRPVELDGVAGRTGAGLPGDEREAFFDRVDEPTCRAVAVPTSAA